MKATLVIKKGSTKTQAIELRARSTLVGRMQGCDVRIPAKSVSRHHCKLRVKYDYLTVEDLDSANGTFVNGDRIEGRKVLRPGDQLQIGPVVFVVKYDLTKSGEINIGGDETVMKPLEVEPVDESDSDVEPIELELADEEDEEEPSPTFDKDTTSSSPALRDEKPQKKASKSSRDGKKKTAGEPAAKKADDKNVKTPDDKKKPPEKDESSGDDTPDASQILDGRHWDPPQGGDLRSLFSDMEDK